MARRDWLALVSVILLAGCAPSRTCMLQGAVFSHGASACQIGQQYRCDDGEWRATHVACADPMALAKACDYGGIAYNSGAASCQAGTQYRCDDGLWTSLGVACPVGDAPIRIVPTGRSCMVGGATVANSSTICRAGVTA